MGNRVEVFEQLGATVVAVEPQAACQVALAERYGDHPRVHLVNAGLVRSPAAKCSTSPRSTR